MRRDLNSFISQISQPPTLPSIYYELIQAVAHPDSPLEEVTNLILQDQSVTVRLLRLANSALYGCSSEIDTVQGAVQLVGLREVQSLVLATSVIKSFDKFPAGLLDVSAFWTHSIACAIGSALLAEERNDPNPERLFVGGLLHDIGRLLMCLGAPEESREIIARAQREGQVSTKLEREILGFDHAALGAELLWLWKFPTPLIDVVEGHHAPPGGASSATDTWLVHYADFIVNVLQIGNSGEFYVSPLVPPSDDEHLAMEQIEDTVEELEKRCESVLPVLTGSTS